jgi:predicted hydrocarbon binding protein
MAIKASVFCAVRERAPEPLCAFYAAGVERLLTLFDLDADVLMEECRATGAERCLVAVSLRRAHEPPAS